MKKIHQKYKLALLIRNILLAAAAACACALFYLIFMLMTISY